MAQHYWIAPVLPKLLPRSEGMVLEQKPKQFWNQWSLNKKEKTWRCAQDKQRKILITIPPPLPYQSHFFQWLILSTLYWVWLSAWFDFLFQRNCPETRQKGRCLMWWEVLVALGQSALSENFSRKGRWPSKGSPCQKKTMYIWALPKLRFDPP